MSNNEIVFKTIQECGLELTSYTVMSSGNTSADFQPCSAARASFGRADKTGKNVDADKKLLDYLARNHHCYHPDMQVLTTSGWKYWKDCGEFEEFVVPCPSLKVTTREVCRVFKKPFDGELETLNTQRMSYKVTPDHNMLYSPKNKKGPAHKIKASELPNWGHFVPYMNYLPEDFHLDEYDLNVGRLLGFYLGDGFSPSKNRVCFRLKKERKISFLKDILEYMEIPYRVSIRDNDVVQFWCEGADWLAKYQIDRTLKARDKRIDKPICEMSYSFRLGLWEGLANSDGSVDDKVKERIHFSSTSPHLLRLWDDISGSLGSASVWLSGKNSGRIVDSTRKGRVTLEARAQHFGKEYYEGDVFCTTTSSGWLVVRGSPTSYPFICGNCTPFEYNYATFLIEAPLFVHEQIKQHRSLYGLTMPNNAISRRYTNEQIEFWIPDKWRKQSASNKQASTEETVYEEVWVDTDFCDREPLLLKVLPQDDYEMSVDLALQVYEQMLEMGVCREQARAVLPQSLLTRFYLGGTLREWAMFLKLRTAEGVQFETRYVAERIEESLKNLWPEAVGTLLKHTHDETEEGGL